MGLTEWDYISSLLAPGQVRPDVNAVRDAIWNSYMTSVQGRLKTYVTM